MPQDRQPGGMDPSPEHSDDVPQAENQSAHETRAGLLRRHPIAVPAGALVFALVLFAGYLYWDYAAHFQSTDDAFVAARQFAVAPKVTGYITAVPVTDNQHVVAGDVIVRIDERDYRIALKQAEAQVASAQASIENTDAQVAVQRAQINANQAQVEQAQANLVFAREQAARYQGLAQKGSGTVEAAQQFASQLHQQEAALKSAQATLAVAQRQIESLDAQRLSAVASLAQAQAQRDQAQLNLSYTIVNAAQPGRVVDLTVTEYLLEVDFGRRAFLQRVCEFGGELGGMFHGGADQIPPSLEPGRRRAVVALCSSRATEQEHVDRLQYPGAVFLGPADWIRVPERPVFGIRSING